jgi:hypothetical protein
MRDEEGGGGAIGRECYVLCQLTDVIVGDGCRTRFAFEKGVDDLLAVEDSAGDAELLELVGEQRDEGGAVALAVRVQETLFERIKVVLKLRVGHAMRSLY